MADLDVRALRVLVAVADAGTLAAAAQELHVSQPALSKQVAAAERVVGVLLFERHPRGMRPTGAGEAILARARVVLREVDALGAEADRLRRSVSGTLRLGFIAQAANEYTPDLLHAFAERHPAVTVDLRQYDMRDLTAGLASGETDLALVRQPLDMAGLEHLEVFAEPRVAVLASGHRLAARDTVALAELFDEVWVVSASGLPAWQRFALALDRRAEPPRRGPVVHTVDEFLEAVATGSAVGLAPRSAMRFYRRPGITYVDVPDAEPSVCTLSWRSDVPLTAAARAFVDVVRERLARAASVTDGG